MIYIIEINYFNYHLNIMLNTSQIKFEKILENTILISNLPLIYILILASVIVIIFLSIFYIIPIISVKFKINKLNKEARNRKNLLNKIITQKQIESEVEEEVKKLELKN